MKIKLAISALLLLLISTCVATEWLYPYKYRSDISGDDACYTNYLLHRPDTTCAGSFYPCCDDTVLSMAAWTCVDFVDSIRSIDTVIAIVCDSTGCVFDTVIDTSYFVMDTTLCFPLPTGWDSLISIVISCTLYIDTAEVIVMYDTVASFDTIWVVTTSGGGLSFTRFNTWACDTFIVPTTPPDTCVQCDSVMHIDWYRMTAGSYLARHIDLWDIPIYSEGTCGVTPSSGGTYISIDIDTCNGFQACAHISYARYGYFYVDYGDSVVFKSCLGDTVKIPSGGGRRDTLWIGTIPPPTLPADTTSYAYGYWVSTCDGALDTVTTAGDTIPFLSLSSEWSCEVYAAAMWSGRYPNPNPPHVAQAGIYCTDDVAPAMISAWLFEHIQDAGLWADTVMIGGAKKKIYECFMLDYAYDPLGTPGIWHSRHVPYVDGYPCREPHASDVTCQLFHNFQREPYGSDVSFETATNCDSILFDIAFDPSTMSYIPDGIIDALDAGTSGYKVICFIAGLSKVQSVVVNGHTQIINFDYYDNYTTDTTFYEVEIPAAWWNWRGVNKVKIGISSYAADACRWIGANALFAVATPTGTTTITRARTWTPIGSELVIPECDTCRTICLHNEWLGAIRDSIWAYLDTIDTTICVSTCSETLDIRDLYPQSPRTALKAQGIELVDTSAAETTYVASIGNSVVVQSLTGQELKIMPESKFFGTVTIDSGAVMNWVDGSKSDTITSYVANDSFFLHSTDTTITFVLGAGTVVITHNSLQFVEGNAPAGRWSVNLAESTAVTGHHCFSAASKKALVDDTYSAVIASSGCANYADYGFIAGGQSDTMKGTYSVIFGRENKQMSVVGASVMIWGERNEATDTLLGGGNVSTTWGYRNINYGDHTTLCGDSIKATNSGSYSFFAGINRGAAYDSLNQDSTFRVSYPYFELFADSVYIKGWESIAALAAILDSVTTSDGDSVIYGWKFGLSSILLDFRTH